MAIPGNRKRKAKELARKARERSQGFILPEVVFQQVACPCGQKLRLNTALEGKRCTCPSCGRKFLVTLSGERQAGTLRINPVYVDAAVKIGNTFIAERTEEPPEKLSVLCVCGKRVVATRNMYDRRVRCPQCGVRLLLTLKRDPRSGNYSLHPLEMNDLPSGETRPGLED